MEARKRRTERPSFLRELIANIRIHDQTKTISLARAHEMLTKDIRLNQPQISRHAITQVFEMPKGRERTLNRTLTGLLF
jgi:hypothetical protein